MTFKGGGRKPVYKSSVTGKRVSGVTTILGRWTDPGGLIFWAFKKGQSNPHASTPYEGDNAAEVGSVVHDMVEKWIHSEDPNDILKVYDNERDIQDQAANAFGNFLEWFNNSGLTITHTEVPVEGEKVGGTIDAIAADDEGNVHLLDWKTSNSTYLDHLLQLSGYGGLWEDKHPGVTISRYHLLRFHKTEGDFHHHSYEDLSEAKEVFDMLVECDEKAKALKKRL